MIGQEQDEMARSTAGNGAENSTLAFETKEKIILISASVAIGFVFLAAFMLFSLQIFRCALAIDCRAIDALSHLIFAWVGAVLGGVLGYLLGGSQRKNGHNGSHAV